MSRFLIVFVFLAASAIAQLELRCPAPKWDLNRRTGRCYWFNNDDQLAQYQADEHCRRWNGRLVTIDDMTENNYVFSGFPADAFYAYIGLNDMAVEAEYRWIEGDKLLLPNATANFPTDYINEPKYDCVVMSVGSTGDGTWKEVQCNEPYGSICEAAATP